MNPVAGILHVISLLIARAMRFLSPLAWRHDLLEVKIDGEMPEELPRAGFLKRFTRHRMTFCDFLLTLRQAKDDPNLSAVVFHIREPRIGWARAWELREAIRELRQSGLATTAFIEDVDNISYYIAAACDEIFIAPSGQVRIRGLVGEVVFLKKGMDKLGVKAELAHEGKYKSAGEIFTRATMSPAHREEVNDILDNLYDGWITDLARDRHVGEKRMKNLVDKGSFLAKDAQKAGLVDRVCYQDEIAEIYEERIGRRVRKAGLTKYSVCRGVDLPLSTHFKTTPRIALLFATGPITSGASSDFSPSGRSTGADTVIKCLRDIREDKTIAGAVLRINSPGGSALASDLIWREMALSARRGEETDWTKLKPFVVSMGDVAASGGYYIACKSDRIFAGPTTVTGSIGVIGGKFNLGGLTDTLGIKIETITRGKTADMDNAFRGYTPAEKKLLQGEIKAVYKDFVDRVSKGRDVTTRAVEKVAKGRVWLGSQAVENGLVDEIGGIVAAIDDVKRRAGIPQSEKTFIDVYPKKKKVMRLPIKGLGSETRARARLFETLLALLPDELRSLAPLVRERGPLAVLPYFLKIR